MKTAVVLTLAVTTTLGLSACGGESKPKAADAITKMQARLKTYKSIDMTLSGTSDQKPISTTLHGPTKGTSFAGSAVIDGQNIQMIQANGTAYTKASAEYLRQTGAGDYTDMFADKWLKGKDSEDEDVLSKAISRLTTKKLTALSAPDTKVASDKLNGKNVWKLTSKDGKNTAWVTKGDFDLLKGTGSDFNIGKNGGSTNTLVINKHDEPENITAPAGAVDVSQLGN